MAIEINKPANDKVSPPEVVLTGSLIHKTGRVNPQSITTLTENNISQESALVFRQDDELLYSEQITVELRPDNAFTASDYGVKARKDLIDYNEVPTTTINILGPNPEHLRVNNESETYYTLNGKDPSRTKRNLYTGSFKIRRNSSGTDNIILKSRTYVRGHASAVRTVKLRILKVHPTVL